MRGYVLWHLQFQLIMPSDQNEHNYTTTKILKLRRWLVGDKGRDPGDVVRSSIVVYYHNAQKSLEFRLVSLQVYTQIGS